MTRPLAMLLLLFAGADASAADWSAVPDRSTLAFRGQASGEPFDGEFRRYTPQIAFEAGKPETIAIDVTIDIASVDTRNAERDEMLASAEFFALAAHPQARFRAGACRLAQPPNGYRCSGELTIKGHTQALEFPFTWTVGADGNAILEAAVTLDRLAYEVGSGEWADQDTVAREVAVDVHLVLKPGA